MRNSLAIALEMEGYDTAQAAGGHQAIELINRELYDLVITDLKMDPVGGLEVLSAAKSNNWETEVIIMTAYASVESAVESMKLGAFDYLTKPFNPDELKLKVSRALERKNQRSEINYLRREVKEKYRFENILGHSDAMQSLLKKVAKVARSDATILIMGESGTGKELIAKAIHNNSPRKENPFIVVNCGALPRELLESELFGHLKGSFTGAITNKKGLLEEANKGSFFLDEVGELEPAIQAKLLRVLQDGSFRRLGANRETSVDVRFLSATNSDLEKAVAEGTFRQDLFYRLNVITLWLPPLRERREDIPLLANHFLQKYADKLGVVVDRISKAALSQLVAYSWPGNIRELENVIEQAVVLSSGQSVAVEDIQAKLRQPDLGEEEDGRILERTEKECILQILRKCAYNKGKAARELGISETTLWRKLKKYGV